MSTLSACDPLLLSAAQSGDPEALDHVLRMAQPDIRRYARRNCHASDLEDAIQESLIILHHRIGSLRNLASLATWLMSVVSRECWRLARRTVGQRSSIDELEDSPDFAHRPPEELRLDLARALESLPEHYRSVILLRDVQEMTIDELAQSLGLTREAAKARLHRARKLMRDYLHPH